MGGGQFGLGSDGRFGGLFAGLDELFGLMDGEVPVDNVVKNGEMGLGVVDIDERTGVGHTNLAGTECQLCLGGEVEQTDEQLVCFAISYRDGIVAETGQIVEPVGAIGGRGDVI